MLIEVALELGKGEYDLQIKPALEVNFDHSSLSSLFQSKIYLPSLCYSLRHLVN